MIVEDRPESWQVVRSRAEYVGGVVAVRVDTLAAGDTTFDREVVTHPGAVAIVALNERDEVLVLSQYRHAAQRRLIELPAGLLDVDDELPLDAAKRELREEGKVEAAGWRPLLDYLPSPGISTEKVWIYLATQLEPVGQTDAFEAEHEEAAMSRDWVGLDELVRAVLAGTVHNGLTIVASLALSSLRRGEGQAAME